MTRTNHFLGSLLKPRSAESGSTGSSSLSRQRFSRRRSRITVLAGLASVVLAHLGLNLALDTIKPEWRDPEYGHRLKELKPLVRSAEERPLVVAIGSSRVQMGFNPHGLDLDDGPRAPIAYNFSQAGCGPFHELLNLKRLLAEGIQPDYLLVEVLPPVLGGHGPADSLMIPARLGYSDLDRVAPYCDNPTSLNEKWLKIRIAPWFHLRLNLISHLYGGLLPWQARQDFLWKQMKPGGWMPYFHTDLTPEKRQIGTAQAQAQYAGYFANFTLAPQPARVYGDLIALCRERGIAVAFFVMPESPTFRSWYPPKAREQIQQYFASLRQDGIPVFDASGWFDDELLFADSHHLMRHGSEQFSRRFGAECLKPWMKK